MCSVNKGDLPIKIWWTLFDVHFNVERNLSNNDGMMITKSGQKASVLTIESAQPRHRGNYTCYARNKGGVAQISAYLAINGDLKFCPFAVLRILQFADGNENFINRSSAPNQSFDVWG